MQRLHVLAAFACLSRIAVRSWKTSVFALLAIGLLSPTAATALLMDRGGGLIYSDLLDITWLADANYAVTSGADADGLMTWPEAMAWAEGLVYQGYDDWRLPVADWPGVFIFAGYIQEGEMGQLFYEELRGSRQTSIHDIHNSSYDLFTNIQASYVQPDAYCTSTALTEVMVGMPWDFNFVNGYQSYGPPEVPHYAWPVRDGDSTPIPEPSTALLLACGLVGLTAARRRRRS